ncbi:MAG: hypothetical protein AAFV53_20600 [Myxococcota bacterium]
MAVDENGILAPLRQLLANRRSPEARALYLQLAEYTNSRVSRLTRSRYADLLSQAEQEEIVGEVLYQLMSGTLAQFRGQTLGELLAFVRTITDRCLWRTAKRRIRERDALAGEAGEHVRDWNSVSARPDQVLVAIPQTPLAQSDADYLIGLFQSGSQANYARACGVSRAAVTQRVQRIRKRIASMSEAEQATTEAWLRNTVAMLAVE